MIAQLITGGSLLIRASNPSLRRVFQASSTTRSTLDQFDISATNIVLLSTRNSFHTTSFNMTKALVLGVYQQSGGDNQTAKTPGVFTTSASFFDTQTGGKLKNLVGEFGPHKKGKAKTFYNLHPDYPVVSVVGLGSPDAGFNDSEDLDEKRENVRSSIASAAKSVRDEQGVTDVVVDPCNDAEAASEGANLALWYFDELKSEKYKKKKVNVQLFEGAGVNAATKEAYERGVILARAQNHCRRLAEMPANLMTPTIFCKTAEELFNGVANTKVLVHDQKWAEDKKMGSFLSVAKGSAEPPKFLEIHYNNKPDSKPFVMVGKGICFDSGGISIKPSANMDKMRYDMGGAANVVSTTLALALLKAPVNVVALAPLCENLPSGTANKPGDVVVAMNGKTIQVDNTDAEGRLILADGLCYAHEFGPAAILDIATLTGAMGVSLGSAATGVFTNNTKLYEQLREASYHTGDRVWRLPLYNHYKTQVTDSQLADLLNIGKEAGKGGSCTAAAFLSEFVKCPKWVHLDIAGVMESKDELPYYGRGMSGRPVRTLYYFLTNFFKNQ